MFVADISLVRLLQGLREGWSCGILASSVVIKVKYRGDSFKMAESEANG